MYIVILTITFGDKFGDFHRRGGTQCTVPKSNIRLEAKIRGYEKCIKAVSIPETCIRRDKTAVPSSESTKETFEGFET